MDLNNTANEGLDSPHVELDVLREIADTLARGEVPPLADEFTWRGQPCSQDELAFKLGVLTAMHVEILDSKTVPHAPTREIGALVEHFAGLPVRDGDYLGIVTVQFGQHVITWGLVISGTTLRAWFDPAQLLQLIAP
jgi:hypothetical protein